MVMPMAYEMPTPEARFTGIFIPVEVLEMEELSLFEMILLSWIDAFSTKKYKGCFASNGHLAERLRVESNTVAKALTRLRNLDLIEDVSFNGRTRVIRSKVNQKIYEIQSYAGLDKNPSGLDKNPSPLDKNPKPSLYIESKDKNKDKMSELDSPPTQHNIKHQTQSSLSVGLSTFLFSKIKEINPKTATPNLVQWQKELDVMMRQDNRTEQEIRELMEFLAKTHDSSAQFSWSAVIKSPKALRKNFASAWAQMKKTTEIKKPTKASEEDSFKNRELSKDFIKRNWVKIRDSRIPIEDKVNFIKIGHDDLRYDELKFNELFKHNLKKIQFSGE